MLENYNIVSSNHCSLCIRLCTGDVNDRSKFIPQTGQAEKEPSFVKKTSEGRRDTESSVCSILGYDYFACPPKSERRRRGARYYDSELGIFRSIDPLAHLRPGLSPFNYCQNSPLTRIDPTGMLDEWGQERQGLEGEGMRVAGRHSYTKDLGQTYEERLGISKPNVYVKRFEPFYFSQISYTFPESDTPNPLEFIKGFSGTFFVSGYWTIDKLVNGQWYASLYAMARSNIENAGKITYWGTLSLFKDSKEIGSKPLEKDFHSLIPENWSHVGGNYVLLPERGNIDLKLYVDYNIKYLSGNANPIIKLSRTFNIYP